MKNAKKTVTKNPTLDEIQQIGAKLKEIRIDKGFTSYEAFANEHELSRAMYGRYEKGQDMRISTLIKILKAMDLTLEEFFKHIQYKK